MVRVGGLILAISIFFTSCQEPVKEDPVTEVTEEVTADSTEVAVLEPSVFSSLCSIDMLDSLIAKGEDIVIVDLRKPEDFELGHLPNARRIWRDNIQLKDFDYGGMAADRHSIEQLMDSLGASAESKVIVYDAKGGCDAARFWWLLKMYGHPQTALLDGGWQGWELSGRPVETGVGMQPARHGFRFSEDENRESYIGLTNLLKEKSDSNIVLLDTRTTDEYSGAIMKKGAFRAGRIPGSIHYDWGNSVQMDKDWLLKPIDHLKHDLEALGVTPDKRIITYCHTGVRSAHTTFVLRELLGYTDVRNYDGSWTEWSYMEQLPLETDQEIN